MYKENEKNMIYCRWAPSLGKLEDTAENIWGTPEYEGDLDSDCVFFGLYGFPDFYALWRHKGKKWILWTGSDIRHFKEGYWLDDNESGARIFPIPLADWINRNCESWVENQVEYDALKKLGIESQICPSFLGDTAKFQLNYQWSEKPKVYISVSSDNFGLYGWDKISDIANKNPEIEIHCYGNVNNPNIPAIYHNVIIHGRIPKEQMNKEIKNMQGALRLTNFEGFSEIIAKSILMGQYPISLIPYPHMLSVDEIGTLKDKKEPNIIGRSYYLQTLNRFPWNNKK